MKKENIIVIAVVAILAVTIGYGIYKAITEVSIPQPILTLDKPDDSDWIEGNKDAKNILVEYSDFQCPACRAFAPFMTQLHEDFPDDLVIVYRHYPLPQHRQADLAARAAEAAGNQGKFWEMNDMLFQNQADWSGNSGARDSFISYATSLSLDIDKFRSDMDSSAVKAKIKNHLKSANEFGVRSTPSFFLNGQKINNPTTYDDFKALVSSAQ